MDEELAKRKAQVLTALAKSAGTSGAGPIKTSRLVAETSLNGLRLRHILDLLKKDGMVRYNNTDAWWILSKGRAEIIKRGLDEK